MVSLRDGRVEKGMFVIELGIEQWERTLCWWEIGGDGRGDDND